MAADPEHLVPLADGWSLWRWFRLKSAGFPAGWVLRAAAPETAAALDRGADEDETRPAFEREIAAIQAGLRALAGDPRFREALLWQNRAAVGTGIRWLLGRPPGADDSRTRKKEYLLAAYLQRYTVKNETIGFFGPVAWGELDAGDQPVSARPGPALLAGREVYFEPWAIDMLARSIADDDRIRPWLAPRLHPVFALEGSTLRGAGDEVRQLTPLLAAILARCDGQETARDIARDLVARPELELGADEEVYDLLGQLAERGVVRWTLEVAAGAARPEEALARALEGVPGPEGQRARGALADLVAARDRARAAAGDPPRLDAALADLDRIFVAATGTAAHRRAGETYAGRTIVYEDCRRDLELRIGRPVIARLARVLPAVLYAARWFTHEIARGYRALAWQVFRELSGAAPGTVGYPRFWTALAPHFPLEETDPSAIVAEVGRRLQERWDTVVAGPASLSGASLARAAAQTFAAPAPGWPSARHVCPDVMVAAAGAAAFARGAFTPVVGEVHIGNTLLPLFVLQQHPDPAPLVAARERDVPPPSVVPVEPPDLVSRADLTSWSESDLGLELGPTRSWRPPSQVLRAGDLIVEAAGESRLEVVHRPSGRRFDVIRFLEPYLAFAAAGHFAPVPSGAHTPRVEVEGVVLSREQWRFAAGEIDLPPTTGDRLARFAVVRRWARRVGLPRWVFARAPEERKPVFVDLDSPIYVEMLARLARRASSLTLSEMLPAIDQTWLPDREGRTYTAELRLVAVDPEPWRGPAP